MGYTTYFDGEFRLSPTLTAEHAAYLTAFASTRRMARDATATTLRSDPLRAATGLPVGLEGGYFVSEEGFRGQGLGSIGTGSYPDVIDHNHPPSGQPGLWCQWIPTDDGAAIVWDENEKFGNYIEWLQYIIEHFLTPWGYALNGEVTWNGEEPDDFGKISVVSSSVVCNRVMIHKGYRSFRPPVDA